MTDKDGKPDGDKESKGQDELSREQKKLAIEMNSWPRRDRPSTPKSPAHRSSTPGLMAEENDKTNKRKEPETSVELQAAAKRRKLAMDAADRGRRERKERLRSDWLKLDEQLLRACAFKSSQVAWDGEVDAIALFFSNAEEPVPDLDSLRATEAAFLSFLGSMLGEKERECARLVRDPRAFGSCRFSPRKGYLILLQCVTDKRCCRECFAIRVKNE
jgi:hypothetical protein